VSRIRRLARARRAAPARGAVEVRDGGASGPCAERLRAVAAAALERAGVPGAQIAVRRRAALLWSATAGLLDGAEPVAPEDRFVIASATKPVTATLLALLFERGALDLDEPVARWLPALPHARRLTPRLLLAHRSGLREYARDRAIGARLNGGAPDHRWTRGELIDAIARLGSEGEPGRRFAYRNSNYVVAAEIAERAGGRDVESLLADMVARPLGLRGLSFAATVPGTRLAAPHRTLLRRAVDLRAVTGGRVPTDAIGPVWGDGGIASSAIDLARFTEALLSGELLEPRTLREMLAPGPRRRLPAYGLGVMTRSTGRGVLAGHDGMYLGWTASTGMDDATGTTVTVVANLMGPTVPGARVARAVRAALGCGRAARPSS
jgi:D-alanyl-D-alanine carboxypeptidase